MTSGCVLRRCRNSYAHVNKNSGISYHTFPSNPLMKQKWICLVRAERSECDWKPTTCSKICSEHFKEEDKYITYKGCIRLLKKSAVPVIPGMCISIDSLNETQSTQTRPYSNAERQKRYRERKKAEQMNACATSSDSSDVQQQTQNVVINKNVDPVEHARNARKRHLNKLRQSRFRARQRFKSRTSSQQAQELVTQETCVDHDSHQDASKDHSSDLSHSTDSYSQTTLTPTRKIKEDFDHLEGEDEGILNIPTYFKIKQEYLEDIDSSMADLSSASSSRTNTAYGSPTRESHIKMCLYEPQNTMDVTALKEEPGSPLSDISIHSDAADSPEEQEIKNKLKKKMKMLNENEEILKRRYEEASILENKHEELLADIKYLQNMFKKKCKRV